MSIRLRRTELGLVALCAARSVPKPGDIYLEDDAHAALSEKFAADFASEGFYDGPVPSPAIARVVEREESDNVNRRAWDRMFGK